MIHPEMKAAFPPRMWKCPDCGATISRGGTCCGKTQGGAPMPKPTDMVEILNGPHAGMTGRVRCITNGKARVVFSAMQRSVVVSVSYLKVSR